MQAMRTPSSLLSILLVLAPTAAAQTARVDARADVWTERALVGQIFARSYSFMAYDPVREQLIRFGGYNGNTQRSGTWTWDGGVWTKLAPAVEPPARYAYGDLVYDEGRDRAVLFGGRATPVTLDDTWEWDGTNWSEVVPTTRPPARQNHGIVYDKARGEVLIFGGFGSQNTALRDMWAFDGVEWRELFPANLPTRRSGHQMAYDEARERVVLFGGYRGSTHLGDTWEWDGVDWVERFPTSSPPVRALGSMTFDGSRGRVLLYGGWDARGWRGDLWDWDGAEWTATKIASRPTKRCCAGMAYDGARGRIVMFGGCDNAVVQDTWELYAGAPAALEAMDPPLDGPKLDAAAGSLPWIDERFDLAVEGATGGFALGRAGFGMIAHDGEPNQRAVARYPMMLERVFAQSLLPVTGGQASWSLAMPPDPNLLGMSFHLQAACRDGNGEVVFSNPATATVGAR